LATIPTGIRVLFIAIPTVKDIKSEDSNTIRCTLSLLQHDIDPDANILCFGGRDGLKRLKAELGTSFVANIGDTWYIHQQLATTLIAARKFQSN
jgi:hypothetical protein